MPVEDAQGLDIRTVSEPALESYTLSSGIARIEDITSDQPMTFSTEELSTQHPELDAQESLSGDPLNSPPSPTLQPLRLSSIADSVIQNEWRLSYSSPSQHSSLALLQRNIAAPTLSEGASKDSSASINQSVETEQGHGQCTDGVDVTSLDREVCILNTIVCQQKDWIDEPMISSMKSGNNDGNSDAVHGTSVHLFDMNIPERLSTRSFTSTTSSDLPILPDKDHHNKALGTEYISGKSSEDFLHRLSLTLSNSKLQQNSSPRASVQQSASSVYSVRIDQSPFEESAPKSSHDGTFHRHSQMLSRFDGSSEQSSLVVDSPSSQEGPIIYNDIPTSGNPGVRGHVSEDLAVKNGKSNKLPGAALTSAISSNTDLDVSETPYKMPAGETVASEDVEKPVLEAAQSALHLKRGSSSHNEAMPSVKTIRDKRYHEPRDVPSWSSRPSHNRERIPSSAGAEDNVIVRDFAEEFLIERHAVSSNDDQLPLPIRNRRHVKSRSMIFRKSLIDGIQKLCRSHRTDYSPPDSGHRSSIATAGSLKHPELELLPPKGFTSSGYSWEPWNRHSQDSTEIVDITRVPQHGQVERRSRSCSHDAKAWAEVYRQCSKSPQESIVSDAHALLHRRPS